MAGTPARELRGRVGRRGFELEWEFGGFGVMLGMRTMLPLAALNPNAVRGQTVKNGGSRKNWVIWWSGPLPPK